MNQIIDYLDSFEANHCMTIVAVIHTGNSLNIASGKLFELLIEYIREVTSTNIYGT